MKRKILIADDEPSNVRILGELLKNDYEIFIAGDGGEALDLAARILPDLIILDVMMPGIDGYDVCRELKSRKETEGIPVIFVTARKKAEDIVRGFEVGGRDYIQKPFYPQELHARVQTHIELKSAQERLADDAAMFEEMNRKLASALEQMEIMARIDPLTGLANRRHLLERLEEETARANRTGRPLSIAMADIDNFKSINDTHGHECGDIVLQGVAQAIKECIRKEDMVARWGGEEFLLFFVETPPGDARLTAERIREKISGLTINYKGKPITLTVTIGVANYDHAMDGDANIRRADDAMYRGKRLSKNCVVAEGGPD
ncbi:MAG TPA: diguanylate cyclase [Spirochaetota bacterium]|nr:diguanylate cyclase [Spirochaetota bacterium]